MNIKIATCQFVAVLSDMFLPNIIWIGLQLGKLRYHKKWCTFYSGTVY